MGAHRNVVLAVFGSMALSCAARDGESPASGGADAMATSADASGSGVSAAADSSAAVSGSSSGDGSTGAEPPANVGPGSASDGGAPQPVVGDAAAGAPSDGGSIAEPADASGCARCTGPGDWRAGDYPDKLTEQEYLPIKGVKGQGDSVRGYKVHVPPSYDPNQGMPMLFALHGLGQNPVMFAVDGASFPAKADKEGFILVMPTGNVQNADGSWGTLGSWNAGECCGGAAIDEVDDVALIRAIAEEVGKHLNVDRARVYATGLSNGGFLSFRLACEAADLFTAVAPGAGAIGSPTIAPMGVGNSAFTVCNPSRPVSVLAMHGTSDPLVPYMYMKPSLDRMAEAAGCKTTTEPAKVPASSGDTTCITYTGCPTGIEITGCTVAEGGHCWFGNETCGTGDTSGIGTAIVGANSKSFVNTDAAWQFLKRFSR